MAEITRDHNGPEEEVVHHETTDANIRAIFIFLGGFVVAMVAIYLALLGLFRFLESRTESKQPQPMTRIDPQKARVPPEPRLQILDRNPVTEMRQLREREDAVLNSYGIADPKTGAVRIPIEEAMKIAAQRPEMFPVRAQPATAGVAPSDAGAPAGTAMTAPVAGAGLTPQAKPSDEREQPIRQLDAEVQTERRPQ